MKAYLHLSLSILILLVFHLEIYAQDTDYRPGSILREDWKEIPAEYPVTQKRVSNPELILGLYGAGKDSIKKSHHDTPSDDPFYIWSGLCPSSWAVTLKHSENYVSKQSDPASDDWREIEFILKNLDWYTIDMETITE